MTRFALRYLWFTSGLAGQGVVGFSVVGVFGVWMLRTAPGNTSAPFLGILLLQMFTAASGFRQTADRGHLDVLLVTGISRVHLGVVHWLVSALPGIVAWSILAAAQWASVGLVEAVGLTLRGLLALFLISSVSWAITLPLPRLSGGILWLLTIVFIAGTARGATLLRTALDGGRIDGIADCLRSAGTIALCPFVLLTPAAANAPHLPAVLLIDAAVGMIVLAVGCLYITRRDYPCLVDL